LLEGSQEGGRTNSELSNSPRLSSLEINDFAVLDNGLGVGQVTSLDGDAAEVAYFDSTTNPSAMRVEAPVSTLTPVALEKQRRCYVQLGGNWWSARVTDRQGKRYRVRISTGHEFWLPSDQLRVRWNRPLPDPIEDLIGLNWSAHPVEVRLRQRYLDWCARQRKTVVGLTGVNSLAVEIHAHQIEIARRVLADPVGRFLLADEVGLGKTIEALMVIRQVVLDDPEACVRVVAPATLCAQWEQELRTKCFIDPEGSGDFPRALVEVAPVEGVGAWTDSEPLDLLVIDEAHRVAAFAHSTSAVDRRKYTAAKRLAAKATCVLLVSATPSLHRSSTFLALLHLLHPKRYDVKDVGAFEEMLARRDEVASALLAIDADDPPEILSESVRDLATVIPEGSIRIELQRLADDFEERPTLNEAGRASVERLKLQTAESFRVDRRMLRTRRPAVERRFPVRGRVRSVPLVVDSPAFEDADAWFEQWRAALLADISDANAPQRERAAELTGVIAERVIGAPGLLASLARIRLGTAALADHELLDLSSSEITVLEGSGIPVGDQEREELERAPAHDVCLPADYAHGIVQHIWGHRASERIVIFTSFQAAALELFDHLVAVLPREEVAIHTHSATSEANEDAVARFVTDDDRCHVLICDESGEEGLNLQTADLLVLIDLPLAADRLEQRLGRVDRFSHREEIPIEVVLTTGRTDVRRAWNDVLATGFRIFDRSIAAFQVVVAESLAVTRARLLNEGAEGLASAAPWVVEQLEAAERELTRSELLDATWVEQAGTEIAEGLTQIDTDWKEWRSVADRLLAKSLKLVRWYHADDIVSYWLRHARVPDIEPEIDGRHRADYFVEAVSHGSWARRSSFNRRVTVERSNVRLLRSGDPLIDAVERYLRERHDDGRVTCIWRKTPRLPDDREQLGFTFHFTNHVPVPSKADTLPARDKALIRRRLIAALPPASTTVRVSGDGVILDEDDDLAFLLAFAYDPRRGDSMLYANARQVLQGLVSAPWEEACRRAREAAQATARSVLGTHPIDAALASARRSSEERLGVLEGGRAASAEIKREEHLSQLVEDALSAADVWLETIEAIAVSDRDAPRLTNRERQPQA
jgi:ATP-dependent helicase HepA